MKPSLLEWILRVAVAGEFLGHGMFGLLGKEAWNGWVSQILGTSIETSAQIVTYVGALDVLIAILVLFYPIRLALLWAAAWGFWTALLRPIVGEPVWDFVERWANWGAPLALTLLQGWPKNWRGWLTIRG
ncbi:hypothetical protein HYW18_00850 [Candidatus Uhrbacteria bacterium]|nr:hypothetical protein [Candidatus Uhrbacteria bacterium]